MITRTTQQEDITLENICAPNIRTPKYKGNVDGHKGRD